MIKQYKFKTVGEMYDMVKAMGHDLEKEDPLPIYNISRTRQKNNTRIHKQHKPRTNMLWQSSTNEYELLPTRKKQQMLSNMQNEMQNPKHLHLKRPPKL